MLGANTEMTAINAKLASFTPSDFTGHLGQKDIVDYVVKLDRLGITDPYHAPGILFTILDKTTKENMPDIEYPDIYNYLINFPSSYTGDSLKSYKGLDAFKWNQSGFVMCTMLWSLPAKNATVITAKVGYAI